MESMWEHEDQPHWRDYLMAVFFASFFPVARLFLDSIIFEKSARRLLFSGEKKVTKKRLLEVNEKKVSKFTESAWKLTYYMFTTTTLLLSARNEPWFGKTEHFWIEWPNHAIKFKLKVLYAFQCGFYVYSVAALMVWETRRKDFGVMMAHHFITIGLIAFSYVQGSYRAGISTLLLHDISDVFLEIAKLCKYSHFEVGASVCFGLFALSWFVLRLVIFPFWIIWSISVEVMQYLDLGGNKEFKQYYFQSTLLIMLFIFHIYWWILICRMLVKLFRDSGKVSDDVRSDSEGED
ncbi:ceramide synthase 1 LOH3 isoform X2 [Physcomitrium patens]|uniref:ceramide synthase 1 LOH3 isoform X2 n=1 Tax=Physcomitrium patens TaxID=3218 RepID=UPI000162251A|nr:LAG1 longevity assurance homolog 3-like isoform X2 [Physcomitrium patens]|eukprot:XP_024396560.1 LAG1 longevity assurance homolog 3-like isoform X2 [Physcomitrella patens]